MNVVISDLPVINAAESKKRLEEVQKDLPSNLHFDKAQRERILSDVSKENADHRERHKMAPFRIQIQFGSKRRTIGLVEAKIRVFESGKKLHGDNDVSMHFCGSESCHTPFTAQYFTGDLVTCPHCFETFARDECPAALGPFRQDMQSIRRMVAQIFYALKGQADIFVLWVKRDIRKLQGTNNMDHMGEHEDLFWEKTVYPYWRVLDDTSNGQSLELQLKNLLG